MKISVFGLGYVGAVSAACLAEMGHEVIGVDVDAFKVDTINKGESPIVEELIGELTRDMAGAKRLHATSDIQKAIDGSEMSLICVGTPSTDEGGLQLHFVQRVAEQIAQAIKDKKGYHLIVVRSTVLPGTVEDVVQPLLETGSGKRAGKDFGLCFHPEFLREGSSVRDFREPPKIVIGASDPRAAEMLASLYTGFSAPLFQTSIRAAEMVKYADNAWHALKVVFGNEIGRVCKSLGIDSHEVMGIFCEDKKLNISPAYLKPGFAYGGSCLPKDLRALNYLGRSRNVDLPVLTAIQRSNNAHLEGVLNLLLRLNTRNIGVLGLSFKRGTDDLRESPLVELVERLLGKGCNLRIHDENVLVARLRGGNKAYVEQRLPHVSELLDESAANVVASSDIIVIGAADESYKSLLMDSGKNKTVVDLVRLFTGDEEIFETYHGICW